MQTMGKPRRRVEILPVLGLGMIQSGDDLATLVVGALQASGQGFEDGDVLVLTSKIVSKAEGRIVELSGVVPSAEARALAKVSGREARFCEVLLRNTKRVWGLIATGKKGAEWAAKLPEVFPVGPDEVARMFASEPTMILAELPNGLCLTDAGIDSSNVEGTDRVILLPADANQSCRNLADALRRSTGRTVAVVVSDTELRTNRFGAVDHAIGSWGIQTVAGHFGEVDLSGRPKNGGMEATVDSIVAAASLTMGNCAEGVPAALVRGATYRAVERGMMPIQEPPSSYLKGVLFNIWCRLRLFYYRLVGA